MSLEQELPLLFVSPQKFRSNQHPQGKEPQGPLGSEDPPQGFAQVPLLSVTVPDGQASAQVPLSSQLPLQHCVPFLHAFPLRLQPIGSAPASPMPTDARAPPTKAAPINLSALPREMPPLASPLASSSKE